MKGTIIGESITLDGRKPWVVFDHTENEKGRHTNARRPLSTLIEIITTTISGGQVFPTTSQGTQNGTFDGFLCGDPK